MEFWQITVLQLAYGLGMFVTGVYAWRRYWAAARRWVEELRAQGDLKSLMEIPVELAFGALLVAVGMLFWPITLIWLRDQARDDEERQRIRETREFDALMREVRGANETLDNLSETQDIGPPSW